MPLEPNTKADVIFSALADLTALCDNYGQVFSPGSPDPSKCHITGKGADLKVSIETCTAILQVINFEGETCKVPIMVLDSALHHHSIASHKLVSRSVSFL